MFSYLSALYLYNSDSGLSKEIEKSSEITRMAPSMENSSEIQTKNENLCDF